MHLEHAKTQKRNFICMYYYINVKTKFLNDPILPPLNGILSLPALPDLWV
jgi:hypothetical protein